jgi:hypothetical protein
VRNFVPKFALAAGSEWREPIALPHRFGGAIC